ncbi:hypothetical protein [Mesobacillus maritimus]|uniref:hypothetical protein n=1 Tax=Mesobacillus maritimus TaxID=1643336 RepID=UPI003850415E
MRKLIPYGLFVILLLGVIQLTLNAIIKNPSENAVTVSSFKSEADLQKQNIPVLEMFLVSQEEVDGEVVETFREYEVIYDENGDIVTKEPTEHYEYIRYKK